MTKSNKTVVIMLTSAFVMFLVTGWFFLWVISSGSLAPGYCQGGWIQLWETEGCRNPVYAQFGFLVTFLAAVIFLILGIRNKGKQ